MSLACAAGPLWLVRIGLLPALGAALVSCWLAWREIGLERRAHAAAMLAVSRRHGAQLSEERRHNGAVLAAMDRRVDAFSTLAGSRAATIQRLDAEIVRLGGDVNGLRGANGRLTRDLNFRDVTIKELRESLLDRETELAALLAEDAAGEDLRDLRQLDVARLDVAQLDAARLDVARLGAARLDAAGLAGAGVLDEDGSERRTAAFLETQLVTMPNYEEDRRLA